MSTYEFKLPELGDGIAEAEVMAWLADEGTDVSEHQVIVEVQTDKALVEITSPVTGTLRKHGAAVGDIVERDQVLASFDVTAADGADEPNAGGQEPQRTLSVDDGIATGRSAGRHPTDSPATDLVPPRRPLAAPTVRRLATENRIDLAVVHGSGPGGRVLRTDVEAHIRSAGSVSSAPPTTPEPNVINATPLDTDDEGQSITSPAVVACSDAEETVTPLRGLRRTIARRMTETLRTVPHVTGLIEIDVTDLQGLLDELRPLAENEGVRLTWTAFFAQATIQALKQFPELNASLDMERELVTQHHRVHLGVATATEQGLLVPVVHNADQMSLLELAAEIGRVSAAARDRTASQADLTGSTFTITNYGAVGGWHGTPMVNLPEIGIVGFGTVEPRPAVVDDVLAVRTTVALSHTVDHRLIDGAVNAQFGNAIRRRLEQPHLLLLGARRHGHG